MDAQDHAQVGRCLAAAWRAGEPCDRGPPVAGGEVLVAIATASGWVENRTRTATDSSACWGVDDDDSSGKVGR